MTLVLIRKLLHEGRLLLVLVRKLLRDCWPAFIVIALLLCAYECLWAKITERLAADNRAVLRRARQAAGLPGLDAIRDIFFQGPGKLMETLMGGETHQPRKGDGCPVDRLRPSGRADDSLHLGGGAVVRSHCRRNRPRHDGASARPAAGTLPRHSGTPVRRSADDPGPLLESLGRDLPGRLDDLAHQATPHRGFATCPRQSH